MTPHDIFKLFGRTVVLLKIAPRSKRPIEPGWENKTQADMTKEFVASLNGNIGVLHGLPSGGLIGIEWDERSVASQFYLANPWAQHCLWSKAKRGPCFWVYIEGDYPANHQFYDVSGRQVGEWRADGRQTVFTGTHPDGMEYKNNGVAPARVAYKDIVWPEGILKEKPAPKPARDRAAIMAGITRRTQTALYIITQRGAYHLNHAFLADLMCALHDVLFEQREGDNFLYDPRTGAWVRRHSGHIANLVRQELVDLSLAQGEPRIYREIKASVLSEVTSHIQVVTGVTDVFKRDRTTIHCGNGMLHLKLDEKGEFPLMPFSPSYYSRNPIPINYNPEAKCPKFQAFLHSILDQDDVSLLIRWFGSTLLTGNAAQRILFLIGEAESGKSTIANVITGVLGRVNVYSLRTDMLKEKFELARLLGCTLLTAMDADPDFMEQEGANTLKSLVGGDPITGEGKYGMKQVPITGDYDVLITGNKRMTVNLQGEHDINAWRRRMMIINFEKRIQGARIERYHELLLREEGEGILALIVAGAFDHLDELANGGNFKTTPAQDERVNAILLESESVKHFVANCVIRVVGGDGLATSELVSAYMRHCNAQGWRPKSARDVETSLVDLMMTIHGVNVGAHIARTMGRVRGYPHVALTPEAQAEEVNF